MARPRAVLWLAAAAVSLLVGCAQSGIQSYSAYRLRCLGPAPKDPECHNVFEIRTRDPHNRGSFALSSFYSEEYAYIWSHRGKAGITPGADRRVAPPPNLIGLALSGGGIRSASFNLGTLEALQDSGLYEEVDYLSAVSGGGYIASWLQAHLGARQFFDRDVYNYPVVAGNSADLLDEVGPHVEQLRTHTGFINRGRWLEGPLLVYDWLWRWPFHLVIDDVLHFRGRFNFHHLGDVYRDRIAETYFRGQPTPASGARSIPDTPLADVNAGKKAGLSPYLILNGNLTNVGRSQIAVGHDGSWWPRSSWISWVHPFPDHWNFEFTRDFVGSDGIGYVSTAGFGLPVQRVLREGTRPKAVVVDPRRPWPDTKPFRLSEASMASGAAFDSAAFLSQKDVVGLTELEQLIAGGVLNAYLGPEEPNFARDFDRSWGSLWDYLRMFSFQRVPRWVDTGARWLTVTDGGHYDNLGLLSLLRRGVSCIVAVDATEDAEREFDSLQQAREEARTAMRMTIVQDEQFPASGNPGAHFRLKVTDQSGELRSVILYLKATGQRAQHLTVIPGFSASRERDKAVTLENEHIARVQQLFAKLRRPPPREQVAVVDDLYAALSESAGGTEKCAETLATLESDRARRADLLEQLADLGERISREREYLDSTDRDTLAQQTAQEAERIRVQTEEQIQAGQLAEADAESLRKEAEAKIDALEEQTQAQSLTLTEPQILSSREDTGLQLQTDASQLESLERALEETEAAIAVDEAKLDPTTRYGDAEATLRAARKRLSAPAAEKSAFDRDEDGLLARWRDLAAAYTCPGPEEADAARAERIEKIAAFTYGPEGHAGFPHDKTTNQTYSWERFEAYRLLGYQTASTFLERLSLPDPDPESRERGEDLDWCRFAPVPGPPPADDPPSASAPPR